jgi:hypothetical protein
MRLQKHGSRKVEGKEYFKWTIVVPPAEIEELGWTEGMELEPKRQGRKLVIEPRDESESNRKERPKGLPE